MNSTYSSKDFYLSAYLISKGFPLVGNSRENPTTTLFEFEDTPALRKYVEEYYSMKSSIEPIQFAAAIRSLKSVIHRANTNSKEQLNNGTNK